MSKSDNNPCHYGLFWGIAHTPGELIMRTSSITSLTELIMRTSPTASIKLMTRDLLQQLWIDSSGLKYLCDTLPVVGRTEC